MQEWALSGKLSDIGSIVEGIARPKANR